MITIKKDYILDNGKIRNCKVNIAKMNVFEYIKFDIFQNKILKHGIKEIAKMYKEGFECLLFAIVSTILIIFFPITLTVKAVYKIKDAKK